MIHHEKYILQGNSGHKNTNMSIYRTDLSFMKQHPDTFYSILMLVLVMTQSGPTHLMTLVVKNVTANAEDIRDTGPTPGSGQSPGGGDGNPLPWTEEPDGFMAQSMKLQRVRHDQVT